MTPSPLKRILDHLRDFGLRGLHLRFLAGASLYREMPVYELDFEAHPPQVNAAIPVDISVLTRGELDEYISDTGDAVANALILWELGAHCFIARHQGRIIARVWAAERSFPLNYLSRRLDLQAHEVYFLDALTLPAFRGKNLLAALLSQACQHYRNQGRRMAFTIVYAYNRVSIHAFEKAGFRLSAIRGYYQFGPWRRDFVRPIV